MTCNWLVRGATGAVLIASMSADAAWPALGNPDVFAPGVIFAPANKDCTAFAPAGDPVYFDHAETPNAAAPISHPLHAAASTLATIGFSAPWLDYAQAMAPEDSFVLSTEFARTQAGQSLVLLQTWDSSNENSRRISLQPAHAVRRG